MGATYNTGMVPGATDRPLARWRIAPAFGAAFGLALGTLSAISLPCRAADDFPPPVSAAHEAGTATPAAEVPAAPGGPSTPEAASTEAPAAVKPEPDVRIEQKHIGRRVSEVIVTPAGFTYHYSMVNLEGQEIGTILQPHPELSIPRFFRFDF